MFLIDIFVDPRTTLHITNQNWGTSLQFVKFRLPTWVRCFYTSNCSPIMSLRF